MVQLTVHKRLKITDYGLNWMAEIRCLRNAWHISSIIIFKKKKQPAPN